MALWEYVEIPLLQTPAGPDCVVRTVRALPIRKLSLQDSSKRAAEEPSPTSPALVSQSYSFIPSSFTRVLPNKCHRSGLPLHAVSVTRILCVAEEACGRR